MLTRFKVSGFKNLVDVDVRFGPFTCIAGANGVGKSNLFDAIKFLSLTADKPLMAVANEVRGSDGISSSTRNLFSKVPITQATFFNIEADILCSKSATDGFGHPVAPSDNPAMVNYCIDIKYASGIQRSSLILVKEFLRNAQKSIQSPWDNIASYSDGIPYIEMRMDTTPTEMIIRPELRSEPLTIQGTDFIQTYLSVAQSVFIDGGRIFLTAYTLRHVRVFNIEPSAIRRTEMEPYGAKSTLDDDGAHVTATLHRIAHFYRDEDGNPDPEYIYARAASRLHELIGGDVRSIRVDDDEKRELYTLYLTDRNGTEHPARSLSDGTLRFLALITLWLDPEATGVFCIEEPENGIHPARLPALVRLLQDIAVNPEYPVGPDNPLRQVIVVTHSPEFVKLVPDDSLLLARTRDAQTPEGVRYSRAEFVPLADTWRVTPETLPTEVASRNELLAYLNPSVLSAYDNPDEAADEGAPRVMDRPDLQPLLSLARK